MVKVLKKIWVLLDFMCGKRLAAILPEVVPILERKGELKLRGETRRQLIEISAATIDRLLAAEKKQIQLKGRLGTKPGALLKHQIPGYDLGPSPVVFYFVSIFVVYQADTSDPETVKIG